MQHCEQCGHQFAKGTVYKSFFRNYKPITCEKCGTVHEVTFKTRSKLFPIMFLPAYAVGFLLMMQLPFGWVTTFFIAMSALAIVEITTILLLPLMLKIYSQKTEQ